MTLLKQHNKIILKLFCQNKQKTRVNILQIKINKKINMDLSDIRTQYRVILIRTE